MTKAVDNSRRRVIFQGMAESSLIGLVVSRQSRSSSLRISQDYTPLGPVSSAFVDSVRRTP